MVDNLKHKKRVVMGIVAVLTLTLQAVLLAACSNTAAPERGNGGEPEPIQTDAGTSPEIPDPIVEDPPDAQPEDGVSDGVHGMEESLLTQEEAKTLTDPLVQWAGLYLMGRAEQRGSFDDTMKMQIAGITLAYGYLPEISEIVTAGDVEGVGYAVPEGYLYVGPEKLQAAERLLFGETSDSIPMKYAQEEIGKVCLNDGEGGMLVMAGDWGLEGPRGEIVSVENMNGNLNMVTVFYVLYNYDEDEAVGELGWIEYLVQGTAESGEPPKIIDVNIQKLYVDQEAYLYEYWKDGATVWETDAYQLEIPGAWEERVHIYQENETCNFICSAAASENYMGVLFTIVRIQRGVAVEAPEYKMLGEDAGGVYIALFPSEEQVDPDDGYAAGEYAEMSRYAEEILSTFRLR